MSKIKNGPLDQYGAEPFEQQQFKTAGVEGVKLTKNALKCADFSTKLEKILRGNSAKSNSG